MLDLCRLYLIALDSLCAANSSTRCREGDLRTIAASSCEIRVITFDLDNTLWNTDATISAANDALAEFVNDKLPPDTARNVRVEKVMGKLYVEDKASYAPIEKEDAKSPVLLTQLRKDAIRKVFKEHGVALEEHDDGRNEQLVEEAFTVWVNARYRTIPKYFADSVLSCLQEISSLRTNPTNSDDDEDDSDSKLVVIGAITDGNSDPTAIPELAHYFDFCVNAETVGISKPDKRVYLRGVARALQHPSLRDISPINDSIGSGAGKRLTDEAIEDLVGPWWVHIGDDFVKDCVAAKNLKMRTIWARELVRDKVVTEDAWKTAAESSEQERTVEELVKEVAELEVVEMQVGADNYLANSMQAEFADAVADEFREVANILRRWQEEAAAAPAVSTVGTSEILRESGDLLEIAAPAEKQPAERPESNETKFCIHCGANLPLVAKFCSSCGEKQ